MSTEAADVNCQHVAIFLPNLRGDGAVSMMLTLAKGFRAAGLKVDLVASRVEGEQAHRVPEDVRLIDLRARRSILAVPGLVRYLRRSRPDILLATEHYSGLPALHAHALARTKTRCVIRQDNTWGMDSQRFKGRHRLLTPWMVGHLFRRADIIAVSKGVENDLVAHFPQLANNVQTIYNPVISDALARRARASVDHPWLKNPGVPVVVATGRLAAAKGFDLLIDAFAKVTRKVSAKLLILGEGPDRSALEAQVRRLGLETVCELPGFQDNPLSFLSKASAFVLSSRFEGLPTVLIEALAAGAPVIATDCLSGPREILDNGRYGKLVPPNDEDSLVQAIIDTIINPPARDTNLNHWLEQFAVDSSVKKHLALFNASLSAPPPQLRHVPVRLAGSEESR